MLVKYQDSCSTWPLGLTRVASSSPNSEVFPLFEGVWGYPRRKSLGYYRKKETKQNKKQQQQKKPKQNHSDCCLQSSPPGLEKQIYGYFWCGPQKAKDGWPGGCQSAKPNSFLSSVLKIYPAERPVRRERPQVKGEPCCHMIPGPQGCRCC